MMNHNSNHKPASQASQLFSRFAQATAQWTGHPAAFLGAILIVLIWIISGPMFNYSDTWQLVINTGTTVITFLMVFLIQAYAESGCRGGAGQTGRVATGDGRGS